MAMLAQLAVTPVVHAADQIPTSTSLLGVTSPVRIDTRAQYEATVTPSDVAGTLWFETSTDGGATWAAIIAVPSPVDGVWRAAENAPTEAQSREIRAHFYPTDPAYAESASLSMTQVITRYPSMVDGLAAWDGDMCSTIIRPGTTPVLLLAHLALYDVGSKADIVFEDASDTGWTTLGTGTWISNELSRLTIEGLSEGIHTIRATYGGDARYDPSSATMTVEVAKGTPSVVVVGPDQVQANRSFILSAGVSPGQGCTQPTGVVSVYEGANLVATLAAPGAEVPMPPLPVGSHTFTATYDGDQNFLAATSAPFMLTITLDIVEATDAGVSYRTFYPYRDNYRDTVAIRGKRAEPITVAIRVYSPTGKVVKSATVAAGTGAYSLTWNGRNRSGAILTAGKYKVVQKLVDAFGTRKTVTSYVTLSRKRLYYSTASVTKRGSSYSVKGTYGSGKILISTSGGYAKLVVRDGNWSNWAAVGYQFTLPAATVYKSLAFQVYMQGRWWSAPNSIKLQNFSTCPLAAGDWDEGCFDHAGRLGADTSAKTWLSTRGSPTRNRSGRIVRGLASALAGTFYIYKARVKVTYGILR
jgi:hypothetical protein